MLVRFVAVALIGFSLAELVMTYAIDFKTGVRLAILPCALKSLPALTGVIILIRARALAQWIADLLDS